MYVKHSLLALAIIVLAAPAMGQERPAKRPAEQGPPSDPLMLRIAGFTLPEAIEQLDLTAEQKARALEIIGQARKGRLERKEIDPQERQQLRRQRESLQRDVEDARKRRDRQAAQAAMEKMRQFEQANAERFVNAREQLAEVLTPAQRAHLAYLMGPGGRFERLVAMVRQLSLTDAQRLRLEQIVEQTRQSVRQRVSDVAPERPAAKRAARAGQTRPAAEPQTKEQRTRPIVQGFQEVMELLAPDQNAQLKRLFARRAAQNVLEHMIAGLDLTAGQKEQIVNIVAAERGKLGEDAAPQEVRQAMKTIRGRIVAEVLTQEQKQILAQRNQKPRQEPQP